MNSEVIIAIVSTLAVLLTATNIATLVQLSSIKKKGAAEAEQEVVKSLNLIIEGNTREIERLQNRLNDAETKYNDLYGKYISLMEIVSRLPK